MFRLAAQRIAPSTSYRCFNTSSLCRSATPQWEELIGGREGVERKRKAYEGKYAAAMEAKAKAEGLSVEELKQRQVELETKQRAEAAAARAAKQAAQTPPPQDSAGPVAAGSEGDVKLGQVHRANPSAESDTARAARAFTKPKEAGDTSVKVCTCCFCASYRAAR